MHEDMITAAGASSLSGIACHFGDAPFSKVAECILLTCAQGASSGS